MIQFELSHLLNFKKQIDRKRLKMNLIIYIIITDLSILFIEYIHNVHFSLYFLRCIICYYYYTFKKIFSLDL